MTAIPGDLTADDRLSRLHAILDRKQKFIGGKWTSFSAVTNAYSLMGINTDFPLELLREGVARFYNRAATGQEPVNVKNYNILLFGPPGTGKTEYVKHLAGSIEKELIVKRASDLLDKYVGGTEKLIADAFREAEAHEAVLFLDEADSLFINREGAHRSWEVSQTNELLCQMENFSGVLACATNHQDGMDPAVMRRFACKVKFDYLLPDGNTEFYRRILLPLARTEPTADEYSRIKNIRGLAPGDFKAVYQKRVFCEQPSVCDLVWDLETEAGIRRNMGHRAVTGIR